MSQVREQAKEAKLLEALVGLFLHPKEVAKVWERAVWNEEEESWQLPRVRPRHGFAVRTRTTPSLGGSARVPTQGSAATLDPSGMSTGGSVG
jgi:hypothetical protein